MNRFTVLLALAFSTLAYASLANAQSVIGGSEHRDRNTSRQGMHACPIGFYMTGVHVGRNELICAYINRGPGYPLPYVASEETVDSGTVQFGMHVCPVGKVMTGLHVGANLLLCAPYRDGEHFRFVDRDTLRPGLPGRHVCPWPMPMAGIHVGDNVFTCER